MWKICSIETDLIRDSSVHSCLFVVLATDAGSHLSKEEISILAKETSLNFKRVKLAEQRYNKLICDYLLFKLLFKGINSLRFGTII